MRILFQIFWLVTMIALIVQGATAWPELPDRFASHFDGSGQPNGWSSKSGFYLLWWFCIIICNIWLPLIGPILRHTPPGLVNLPNKDRWLATPGNTELACSILRGVLGFILGLTNVILIIGFNGVREHALGGEFIFSLPLFLTLMAVIVVVGIPYSFLAFRNPPPA